MGCLLILKKAITPHLILHNKWGHDLFMFWLQYDGNKFYFFTDASIYVPADGGISTRGLIKKLFGSYNT